MPSFEEQQQVNQFAQGNPVAIDANTTAYIPAPITPPPPPPPAPKVTDQHNTLVFLQGEVGKELDRLAANLEKLRALNEKLENII